MHRIDPNGTVNAHCAAAARVEAVKGMYFVRPIVVPAGDVIYRFYDGIRSPTPQLGADGGWWFQFEDFQTIRHFALRNGYSIGYSARLFAAILYEWSEVNAFVACRALEPLFAWKGRGAQVRSSGKDMRDLPTMTPMQSHLEVYQLFVPGIGGPLSMSRQVLKIHRHGLL